jgi:hypothetical protein
VFHAADAAIAVTSARHHPDARVGVDVMVAAQRLEPLAYLPERIRGHADRWEHAPPGQLHLVIERDCSPATVVLLPALTA